MNPASNNKKVSIISLGILAVLLIAAFVCWASFRPQALESVKEITITVTHSDDFILETESPKATEEETEENEPFILEVETTAKTLWAALEPYEILELADKQDGPYIAAADGEYADYYRGECWVCYADGEILEEALNVRSIEDGESYYFYITTE